MKTYVIGHKKPDTDSIAAAIGYAFVKNVEGTEAIPARAGPLNLETQYALNKFRVEPPRLLTNVKGCKLILVDHNEPGQIVDGFKEAEIIEILDHHRLGGLITPQPIRVCIEPVGSTSTLVAKIAFEKGIKLSRELAGVLLSAIISDTVIFKSPTCTDEDRAIAEELSRIAGVDNITAYGIELFKVKSAVSSKKPEEIILGDFKEYDFSGIRVGIGQVETVDLTELDARRDELLKVMKRIYNKQNYNILILMITDIINEGSLVLYVADKDAWFKEAFSKYKMELRGKNAVYMAGLISRKKQVVPKLEKYFSS